MVLMAADTSVHQNPSLDNKFFAKKNSLFRGRLFWLDFWKLSSFPIYLDHENINDKKMSLLR